MRFVTSVNLDTSNLPVNLDSSPHLVTPHSWSRFLSPSNQHLRVLIRHLESLPEPFHSFAIVHKTKIVFLDQLYKNHLDDQRGVPAARATSGVNGVSNVGIFM